VRPGFLLAALLLFGCATLDSRLHEKWDPRLGNYTYDQAVLDYGPPAQEQTVSSGEKVAVWHRTSTPQSVTTYNSYTHQAYTQTGPSDFTMKLTFGPSGILTSWHYENH